VIERPPAALPSDTLGEITQLSINMLRDAIVVADIRERDAPLVWVSQQFSAITGYSPAEALGKNCRYLQGSDRLQPELQQMRDALRYGRTTTVTIRNYRKDGTLFWNELTLTPQMEVDGSIAYYVGLIRDVTVAKENLDQIARDLRMDRLTGLPNRQSFLEDIERIKLSDGSRLLVIKLDLVGLHNINSIYGYAAGDEIIRMMAPETVLAKIASAMLPPFAIPDAFIGVKYALGYTLGSGGQASMLLTQQAGYALHESKADPARAPRRFDETAERVSRLRSRLTAELRQAVRDGDFIYHYQPQCDLQTGRVTGVEGLIRWNHPVFGLQWPDAFIGVAEQTGLIIDIERAGLREVAVLAAKINKGRRDPLIFAVNISPLEITHGNLEGLLGAVIGETGIDPSWLTLELTESLLTEGSVAVVDLFRRLRALGVGLAIDDFGTGYSSLCSIERFPISEIKIDRSFTKNILHSATSRIITKTILSLGQELGIRIVAEGIETAQERIVLKEMGCLIGQGYLFSRPLPAAQLSDLLAGETSQPLVA
jgi:PAS domain S-box-containing protein